MPLLLIGILLQWVYYPFQFWADGKVRFDFITGLIDTATIGQMKYSLIGPIVSSPLALLDKSLGGNYWLLRYNLLLLCLGTLVLYMVLKKHVQFRFIVVFMTLLFFASMFPGHIIHYYGEVFSALFITLGIAFIEKNRTVIGWLLILLSVGNAPATFVPLLLICAYKIVREKDVRYFLLPVLSLIVFAVDSKLRMPRTTQGFSNYLLNDMGFSTVLPYSGRPGFSYPMAFGILGELFSFGKGLLFFTPGLLLTVYVWKRLKNGVLKKTYLLWLIYLVGLILVYSKWWAWYGGWFWGPRFLLFASIPASFNVAHVLTDGASGAKIKAFALLIAFWSFWVGASGVIFGQTGLDVCTSNNYALEHLCWYVPEFSALFHPFVTPAPINTFGWITLLYSLCLWLYVAGMTYIGIKKRRKKE